MLSYHLKLKTAISRFVFQIFHVNKLWWFVTSNWISALVKNKSVKLTICNLGTSGDDSSALTEFTPLWKTKVSNYPLPTKRCFFYKKITQKFEFQRGNSRVWNYPWNYPFLTTSAVKKFTLLIRILQLVTSGGRTMFRTMSLSYIYTSHAQINVKFDFSQSD